jgi:hypothetical protein
MTTKDRHRVKVVETEQRAVGHQAPQKLMSFITRRDDKDEAVVHCKWPRKPPDQSNNASHCLEPWNGTLHRAGEHIGPVYASIWSRDRGGEAVHGGNKCQQTFVCKQKDALDMLTSSSDPQALVVIDEQDSELIHPIRRGMCSGNPRHSDRVPVGQV